MTALPAGGFLAAAATYGRRPRRTVRYSPARRRLADKAVGAARPTNCPTRDKEKLR